MSDFEAYDGSQPSGPSSSAEVDAADAYEQDREILEDDEPDLTDLPDDVDPADAYEQHLVVGVDEDEYDGR